MKKPMLALLLLAFTADFLIQFPARVFAGPAKDVEAAMQLLKSKAAALGAGGTATIFVKSGDEFVRVATNVKKDDGSRAIGTMLDPKGKAIAAIAKGESYFGEADILGKPYVTGYEPIRDPSSNVIGVYYVGYLKN